MPLLGFLPPCRQSLASLTECVGNGRVSDVLPTEEASSGGSWYTDLSDARYSGWLLRHKQSYKAAPIPPLCIQTSLYHRFICQLGLMGWLYIRMLTNFSSIENVHVSRLNYSSQLLNTHLKGSN